MSNTREDVGFYEVFAYSVFLLLVYLITTILIYPPPLLICGTYCTTYKKSRKYFLSGF